MKKLLAVCAAAALLSTAGAARAASGLGLRGETGLARTPMAAALPPLTLQVAGDYVGSDDLYLPLRIEFGAYPGLELGAHYWYLDIPGDSTGWGLNAKYVFPEFVEKLGLAVGGHWKKQELGEVNNDGHDVYAVASYRAGFLVPSLGFMYESITGDNDESDFRAFASLVGNVLPTFSLGAEFMTASDKLDGDDPDPAMWFGARFVPLPSLTVQAGMLNYADFGNPDRDEMKDFVFHVGVQYDYSFQR